MVVRLTKRYLLAMLLSWPVTAVAQQLVAQGLAGADPVRPLPAHTVPIEFLSTKGVSIGPAGRLIYRHTGSVKLRHRGVLLFCDQAIHDVTGNRIEATGHVLIVQGDTTIIKGDTLFYNGDNRRASLRGRVTFQDRRIVINAARIDCDLITGVAHYVNGGRLVDSRTVMTSREGYYDTQKRQVELQFTARLVSPDNTLTSDMLIYNAISRIATIVAPTRISGKDGVNVVRQGQFDTQDSRLEQTAPAETLRYVKAGIPSDVESTPRIMAGLPEPTKVVATSGVVAKTTTTKGNVKPATAPVVTPAEPKLPAGMPTGSLPVATYAAADVTATGKPKSAAETPAKATPAAARPAVPLAKMPPAVSSVKAAEKEKTIVVTQAIKPVDPNDPAIANMLMATATNTPPVETILAALVAAEPKTPPATPPASVSANALPAPVVARKPTAISPAAGKVKRPVVAVKPPKKDSIATVVVVPTPVKKPQEPVTPAATVSVAAVPVPATKPQEQMAVPVTPVPVASVPATATAPTQPSVLITVGPGAVQLLPAKTRRPTTMPALKRVTTPTPDPGESDLERELNRKKRFN